MCSASPRAPGGLAARRNSELILLAPCPAPNGTHSTHRSTVVSRLKSDSALSAATIRWCVVGLALALAPHVPRFPLSTLVGFGFLAAWRLVGAQGGLPLPNRAHRVLWSLKQLLALAAFCAIYIRYRGEIGREAGVMLLTVLLGLKVLELELERDFYVVSFLAYFLVVTNFFYSQSVLMALYMLVVVAVITASVVRFNSGDAALPMRHCLRLACVMMIQALPLMVFAFVLFPRVPGPLWGLPQDAFSAVSGLSESMTVGRITALGVSDEIAFRAKFEGPPPRARDLYWRGPVLWDTDGRTWRSRRADGPAPHVVPRGATYRYSVLLEPTGERWLLGLDAVIDVATDAHLNPDLSLRAKRAVTQRQTYALTSAPDYLLSQLSAAERSAALALPTAQHPRAVALATAWRAHNPTPAALVAGALDYFRHTGFVYTLLPPALPEDSVDQFLFETHAGFCEHFAASFVVLMRAAGVPARVVTGYQGGEINDLSDYLVIRQRDAHAWAEVYLPHAGWVRVDPTAVVAPARLSLGSSALNRGRSPLTILDRNSAPLVAWRGLLNIGDAANTHWAEWVLGYSAPDQQVLFRSFGFEQVDTGEMVLVLTTVLALSMGILALITLRTHHTKDPVVEAYHRFCRKLARGGCVRAPHEGPLAFAARSAAARPDLRAEIVAITELYTALRYAGARFEISLLKARVRRFKVGRRSVPGPDASDTVRDR